MNPQTPVVDFYRAEEKDVQETTLLFFSDYKFIDQCPDIWQWNRPELHPRTKPSSIKAELSLPFTRYGDIKPARTEKSRETPYPQIYGRMCTFFTHGHRWCALPWLYREQICSIAPVHDDPTVDVNTEESREHQLDTSMHQCIPRRGLPSERTTVSILRLICSRFSFHRKPRQIQGVLLRTDTSPNATIQPRENLTATSLRQSGGKSPHLSKDDDRHGAEDPPERNNPSPPTSVFVQLERDKGGSEADRIMQMKW